MSYEDIKNLKADKIALVEQKISEGLAFCPTELNTYFKQFIFQNAKRLRPLFILLMADALKIPSTCDVIDLCAVVELLHTASLIHDDILDNGKIRRNMPCIHIEKSVKTAVLAGDYLLSLSMNLISKLSLLKILSKATYLMTKSEIASLESKGKKPAIKEYLQTLKEKTSALFSASLECLGEIGGVEIDSAHLEFAENFGIAFQIKDDLNNYLKLDKNKLSCDINEGTVTLPLILGGADNAFDFLNDLIEKTKNKIQNKNLIELINLFRGDLYDRRI